jgi:Uma2 family endonuclease
MSNNVNLLLGVPADPIWRLTVAQYHQMIDADILTEDDWVELLDGWLVAKMPKKPAHSLVTQLVADALRDRLPDGHFVNVQEPITTPDSEPEPDVTVIRGERCDFVYQHPEPENVALLVEVSDATLQRDRGLKLRVYAQAKITMYWIVNLVDERLEVYSDLGQDEPIYQQHQVYTATDTVPVVIDGREVARLPVVQLLG